MLGGYAIETLLKMVIVAAHCAKQGVNLDTRKAEEFLPKMHDLHKLLEKTELRSNKSERELLKDLSKYTVWAGRYPIPLFAPGYTGPAMFGIKGEADKTWLGYKALYPKLARLASARLRKLGY